MRLDVTEVTSKHARSDAELLVMAPIKPGFVELSETLSYASRLQRLLTLFFEFRRALLHENVRDTPQPIEMLRTIAGVQWTLLEEERKLLVAVTFDRSWEAYFERLIDVTGPLLDALFIHCSGYDKHTCADGYESFTRWLRQYQRPCDFLYTSDSQLTLDDARIHHKFISGLSAALTHRDQQIATARDKRELAALLSQGKDALTRLLSSNPLGSHLEEARHPVPAPEDLRSGLIGTFELRHSFPAHERIMLRDGRTKGADMVYDDAARSLLGPIFEAEIAARMRAAGEPPPAGKALTHMVGPLLGSDQGKAQLGKLDLPPGLQDWLVRLFATQTQAPAQPTRTPSPTLVPSVDSGEVQGNLLEAFPKVRHGRVLLIRCDDADAASQLLQTMEPRISWQLSRGWAGTPGVYCNLAITYEGLLRMQLGDDTLERFPKEFREGMEKRAALVGDVGEPNHPRHWHRPQEPLGAREIALSAVDFCVVLQCDDEAALKREQTALTEELKRNRARVLHVQPLERTFHGRTLVDPFGLSSDAPAEAESQPRPAATIEGTAMNGGAAPIDAVALGELLLGYHDRHGIRAVCAEEGPAPTLFKNGSFLVLRKLEQHADRFATFVAKSAERAGISESRVKALMIGREGSGVPLAAKGRAAVGNDFDYESPDAARCPLHAHIRRSNPRFGGRNEPDKTPRILRRSFAYRDEDGTEGLMFMAFNTSIATQFEVIQSWINGANSTGLHSWQNDLLCGTPAPASYPRWAEAETNGHAGGPSALVRLESPEKNLVSLRWGLYLFVPSRSAVQWLRAERPARTRGASQSDVEKGRELIRWLDATQVADPEVAKLEWKRILEDPACSVAAQRVWAALREGGAPSKNTSYGRLVAGVCEATQVLSDDGRVYSVCEYDRRLRATMGPHYLGFDASSADYEKHAPNANQALYDELRTSPFKAAANAATDVLRGLQPCAVLGGRSEVHVRDHLATGVVLALCVQWLGLPNDRKYLQRFVEVSRYAFAPHPSRPGDDRAQGELWVDASLQDPNVPIGRKIAQQTPCSPLPHFAGDPTLQALVGAVVGFAAPAIFAITSVLDQWIESGELGSLCELLRCTDDRRVLYEPLLEALADRPAPPILYRTDTRDGTRVVIGLGSVYRDAKQRGMKSPEAWLFGGPHRFGNDTSETPHGCPVREPALQVLLATVTSLLRQKNLRRERRLVVSFCQ